MTRDPLARPLLRGGALALVALVALGYPGVVSGKNKWTKKGGLRCEPPHRFYSTAHDGTRPPCCPLVEGMCPAGAPCNNGSCADKAGIDCNREHAVKRPNIVLFLTDDQGECHYGSAGKCRSPGDTNNENVWPIPAPKTPNLDLLAAYGTVFPIAHNTAATCWPSVNAIFMGRYQAHFNDHKNPGDQQLTLAKTLRSLGANTDPALDDAYDDYTYSASAIPRHTGNTLGGYCTLLSGKFWGVGDDGFDAKASTTGKLGRIDCGPGNPPLCGTEINAATGAYDPFTDEHVVELADVFDFIDSMFYQRPDPETGLPMWDVQPFFAWVAPTIPHKKLDAAAFKLGLPSDPQTPILDFLFGSLPARTGGSFGLSAGDHTIFDNQGESGDLFDYYGNVWWTDDGLREIRKFLAMKSGPHCVLDDPAQPSKYWRTKKFGGSCNAAQHELLVSNGPNLAATTVIIHLSDNGFDMPRSKHHFTENGFRTRMIVYDPRETIACGTGCPAGSTCDAVDQVCRPVWNGGQVTNPPPPRITRALAHGVDVLPMALDFAINPSLPTAPVPCPDSHAGEGVCDGLDLRRQLFTRNGTTPDLPTASRRSLCGHDTSKGWQAEKRRFLVTGADLVGRCALESGCSGNECGWQPDVAPTGETCPSNAHLMNGVCRIGLPCLTNADCPQLNGQSYVCRGFGKTWCREDRMPCTSTGPGCTACEPQILKFYVDYVDDPADPTVAMTELLIDPDENGAENKKSILERRAPNSVAAFMSDPTGPYAALQRRLNCCVDAWWRPPYPLPGVQAGTICTNPNSAAGCTDALDDPTRDPSCPALVF